MSFRFDCYLVVPDTDRVRVLLVQDDQNWALPHFAFTEDHFGIVDHVSRTALECLGLSVTVLRCLSYGCQPNHIQAVYLMETHAETEPTRGQWADRGEVALLPLGPAEHKRLVNVYLVEPRQGDPSSPAYTHPGWYASTVAWAEEQLGRVGRRVVGPTEQLRLWQRCCLIRVPMDQGFTFLKAVHGPFAHEPALTHELSHRFPARVPQVLAADAARGLLLTADFGGHSLEQAVDVEAWERAVRQYAELQVGCVGLDERWLALGCPDRRLDVLGEQLAPLLADAAPMVPEEREGLPQTQKARLLGLVPRFLTSCDELAALGLPATLCHGDLCAGNVALTPGSALFFDWSDASLSHPFFDLMWLLHGVEERFLEQGDVRQRLRDAYLEPWEEFVPMDRLQAAFALSKPLAALHHALTYSRYILPNVETGWEMAELVPFFLGMALNNGQGELASNSEGIQNEFFRAVVDRCVSECRAHYGERLVAIYVYGSVHRDEAIPGISDLDASVFTTDGFSPQDAEWRRQINDRLGVQFPPPPSGWMPRAIAVGAALPGMAATEAEEARIRAALRGIMHGARPDEEASKLLRRRGGAYLLRQDATRVWGDELTRGQGVPPPDALWARVAFQCPWDGVRHAAGLRTAQQTAFTEENVTEWGLPEEPARKLRKLARLAVLGGAFLLMAQGNFVSYRAAGVLGQLGRVYPEWRSFLEHTGLSCTALPEASPAEVVDYLRLLVPWMDWVVEQFPAITD